MMKLSKIKKCALSLVALSLIPNSAWASYIFDGYCTSNPRSFKEWTGWAEAILIGKVTEVEANPFDKNVFGSCWAKFDVKNWIKSAGPQAIWVSVLIEPSKKNPEDFQDLRYCPFRKNEHYLIMGYHVKSQNTIYPEEYIGTATNNGSLPTLNCAPNTLLTPYSVEDIADRVRFILEKGN